MESGNLSFAPSVAVLSDDTTGTDSIGLSVAGLADAVVDGMAKGLRYGDDTTLDLFCGLEDVLSLPCPSDTTFDVNPEPFSFCFPFDFPFPGLLNASCPIFVFFPSDLVRDSPSDSSSSSSSSAARLASAEPAVDFPFP